MIQYSSFNHSGDGDTKWFSKRKKGLQKFQ